MYMQRTEKLQTERLPVKTFPYNFLEALLAIHKAATVLQDYMLSLHERLQG